MAFVSKVSKTLIVCAKNNVLNVPVRYQHEKSFAGITVAIRREDQSVWERRSPFSPAKVRRLVRQKAKVIMQPSNRRSYPHQAYQEAGAVIQEDISEASVIMGVKQVPVDALLPDKTYVFFSHTIKAQEDNMPLLDACLERNIRLIDYEKLVDDNGVRVVAFGKYAGVAGMCDLLHGLGLRLLVLGHHTPFMHVGPAHNYRNTEMLRAAIRDCGYEIALGNMPKSMGPLTFVFTGSGNVSQGAQEVFRELPYEYVTPEMLKKVAEHGDMNKIYVSEVRRADHLIRKDGGKYDPEDYSAHPEEYTSTFSKTIAPYTSVLINCIYWGTGSPRLLTIPDMKSLAQKQHTPWITSTAGSPTLPHRLLAICDISADPGGSIEFMKECTTIDAPFTLYDADINEEKDSFVGDGVLVCSIDNMPTQLPREATDFFGELLYPHIDTILTSEATKPFEQAAMTDVVKNAVITSNGKLTPRFEYIQELRNQKLRSSHKTEFMEKKGKNVFVLGAGYVSSPLVEYLTRDESINVTLGSAIRSEADVIAAKYPNVEPVLIDVAENKVKHLDDLIQRADVVVSLLPYTLHPIILKECIKHRTNVVTASYCTPAMRALHDSCIEAGITVVNEVGLDPGIDHMLAMECFEEVHRAGGKVDSFISYCGGLPAPEFSNNPLRYKFSWSPRAMIMAAGNGARYLRNGKEIDIEPGELMDYSEDLDFLPGFSMEGYPNRDSLVYKELYGIQETKNMLRGTIRYRGSTDAMKGLMKLGLNEDTENPNFHPGGPDVTWKELIASQMGVSKNVFHDNFVKMVKKRIGGTGNSATTALEQLGLFSDDTVKLCGTPLDTLSAYLAKRLTYGEGERDMVVMNHLVDISWPDNKKERRSITLCNYGDPTGYSAMAKTVGYPCAMATKMLLTGEIQDKGMVLPLTPDVYKPILIRLKNEGIYAKEIITEL